jgi:DAK2 domain fusion protein YloV
MTKYKNIDGNLFKKIIINGFFNLTKNYQKINNLNVFPIPDGDTGTNMQMTMMKGVKQIQELNEESIIKITKIFSDALLLGSKGNSGVILSQFFLGIYEKINELKKKKINISEFVDSFKNGYNKAYESVIEPVEGTILTVLRESIEPILPKKEKIKTIQEVLKKLLKYAEISLQKTPQLLPILKKSNVVDSGGAGFVSFLEGMFLYFDKTENNIKSNHLLNTNINLNHQLKYTNNIEKIKYSYCTEFIFQLKDNNNFDLETKKKEFSKKKIGNSLILLKNQNILKIHIHTNQPGYILNELLKYGSLIKTKIDNMKEQTKTFLEKQKKENIIITISNSKKIKKIFKDLRIDYIIETKNNFIENLKNIFQQNQNNNIILLPDSNQQKEEILKITKSFSSNNIEIMDTNNIGQIYSAVLVYNKNLSLKLNLDNMKKNIQKNKIGKIHYPEKNIKLNENISQQNNFIACFNNKYFYDSNLFLLIKKILNQMINIQNKFLTIFYDNNFLALENLKKIKYFLKNKYPDLELEKIENNDDKHLYVFVLE